MVFVSIGIRMLVEAEAMNMVEPLGMYTRHRAISVLRRIKRQDGTIRYRLVQAPAISGQSIANAYSRILVQLAPKVGLYVCDECRKVDIVGGFIKHAGEAKANYDELIKCIVEDLTGFLIPEARLRRTSSIWFSYMVPDMESAKAVLEPQFHVRFNFENPDLQQPFTIESGTAIYMLTIGVDVDKIGRKNDGGFLDTRDKRVELAFKALAVLIEGAEMGAKKSRYLPIRDVLGAVASISDPISFVVSPPIVYRDGRNYIADTINRAKSYVKSLKNLGVNETIEIVCMDREGLGACKGNEGGDKDDGVQITPVTNFTDLMDKVIEGVKKLSQGSGKKQ